MKPITFSIQFFWIQSLYIQNNNAEIWLKFYEKFGQITVLLYFGMCNVVTDNVSVRRYHFISLFFFFNNSWEYFTVNILLLLKLFSYDMVIYGYRLVGQNGP